MVSQLWKKCRISTVSKRSFEIWSTVCFHGKFEKMLEITSLWGSVSLKMWLFFACYCCGQSGLVVKMSSLDTSRCENSRQKCCFWCQKNLFFSLLSPLLMLDAAKAIWDAAKIKAERWKSAQKKRIRFPPFPLFRKAI